MSDEQPFDVQEFMQSGGIVMPMLCERHNHDIIVQQLAIPETGPWRVYLIVAQILLFQGTQGDERFQKRVGSKADARSLNIVLSEVGCVACFNDELYQLVVRLLKKGHDYAADVSRGRVVDEEWQRWIGPPPKTEDPRGQR